MREGRKTVRHPASRLSDSLFRRTVEDAPLGISVSRGEQILYVNKAWRRLHGVPPRKKVVGLSHMVFVAPEEQRRISRITKARQAGEECPASYDTWVVRADGTRIALHVSVTPVDLEDGRAELVFLEDISERLRAEERLRWLSRVAEQVGEGVAVADLEGNLIFVNEAWAAMHGYDTQELVGQHLSVSHSPDQISREVLPFNEQVYSKGRHSGEVGHIRRDGTPFPTEMTSTLLMDEREQVIGLIGFAKDITEPKRAAESLRLSEEKYRDLVENSQDLICTHDLDGRFLSANKAALVLSGYEQDELVGKSMADFMTPKSRAAFSGYLSAILRDGQAQGLMGVRTKSGQQRFWEFRNTLRTGGPGEPYVRGMAWDVTERRAAEEALRVSEERFRTLAETTSACIAIYQDARLIYVNPAWERLVGCTLAEACQRDWWEFIHPDHRELVKQRSAARLRGESVPSRYEIKALSAAGREWWGDFTAGTIEYFGRPAVLVTALDISERKLREAELAESEARFRALADLTAANIIIFRGPKLLYANPAWLNSRGYTLEEAQSRELRDFLTPDFHEEVRQTHEAILSGEVPSARYEIKIFTKAGAERWMDSQVGLIIYQGEPAVLVTAFDITDRKRAEEALREREKLYRLILENVEEIVWSVDLGQDPVKAPANFISRQVENIIGYTPEEILGDPELWFDTIIHPEDRERVRAITQEAVESREPRLREYRMRHKETGETRWVEDHIVPVFDEAGRVVRIQGVARDVTERKKSQAELERKNRELLALVNSAHAMTGFLNLEEAARAICRAAVEAFDMKMVWIGLVVPEGTEVRVLASYGNDDGYTKLVKVRWDESSRAQGPCGRAIKTRQPVVMWPDQADFAPWREEAIKRGFKAVCAISLVHEDAVRGVITFYSEDPGVFSPQALEILEIFARQATMAVVNASLYSEASRTIHELNAALQELQKSQDTLQEKEERYRGLVENAKGVMLLWTPDLKVTYWNDYAEEFFGFTKEEILGRSLIGTIVPRWESSGRDLEILVRRVASDPDAYASNINQNVTKDGRRVWVAWTNRPIVDAEGRVVVVLSHGTDITALKEAEAALRESEERYRALVETSPEAIVVADLQGHITMVNRRVLEMWGTEDPSDIIGRSVLEFVPPEERLPLTKSLELILTRGLGRDLPFEIIRKDGTSFPAKLNGSVIRTDEGIPKGMMGVVRDITQEKHAEEVLRRSEYLYRTMVESAQDFISVVGKDEVVQYVNAQAAASMRSDPGQIIGQSLTALFPAPAKAQVIRSLREVFESKKTINEISTVPFPGKERVLDINLIPLQDADGNVIAALCISREITDRKNRSGE